MPAKYYTDPNQPGIVFLDGKPFVTTIGAVSAEDVADMFRASEELPAFRARIAELESDNSKCLGRISALFEALKYARRFMTPDKFDIAYIDRALDTLSPPKDS